MASAFFIVYEIVRLRRPKPAGRRRKPASHQSAYAKASGGHSVSQDRAKGAGETGGGWGRDRTADPRLMSPLLYQLSYPAVKRV